MAAKQRKKTEKVSNQKAAASILRKEMKLEAGQAETLVKRARDGGCSAFDHRGCVNMGLLRKWIGDNRESLSIAAPMVLKDQKLNEEIRKLKIANDQKEKLVVLKSAGAALIDQIGRSIDDLLMQKLENEYPSIVAGMDVPQIRVIGKRFGDTLRLEHQKFKDAWDAL